MDAFSVQVCTSLRKFAAGRVRGHPLDIEDLLQEAYLGIVKRAVKAGPPPPALAVAVGRRRILDTVRSLYQQRRDLRREEGLPQATAEDLHEADCICLTCVYDSTHYYPSTLDVVLARESLGPLGEWV